MTSEDSSDSPINIGVNLRAVGSTAIVTGVLTLLAIVGIVTGQEASGKILFLGIIGPMFVLSLMMVLRRRPIMVLDAGKLIDVRGKKTLRWDTVVDARLTESKGLFGRSYHQLEISGLSSGDRADRAAAGDSIRVTIDSIDQLSLSWERIAALVERYLPETVTLTRVSAEGRGALR